MLMRRAVLGTLAAAFVLAPDVAFAHTGQVETNGLMHGLVHPVTGVDHVLAMVAVGLLAAHLGGRALWLVPLSFVAVMAVAGIHGMAGIQLVLAEVGIAFSVVVLGLAVAFRLDVPTLAAMALVGFFAVFHGNEHGAEMPAAASGFSYAVGFVLTTALLHAIGVGLGLLTGFARGTLGPLMLRAGAGAMALFGIALLADVIL
jgi:urease accessory protein